MTFFCCLAGCAQTPTHHLHHSMNPSNHQLFNRIIVIPAEFDIVEVFTGGIIETIPEWNSAANQNTTTELLRLFNFEFNVNARQLEENEYSEALEKSLNLYNRVAYFAKSHTTEQDMWPHKVAKFDYTIGDGLKFLKNKNIDAAMIINGTQPIALAQHNQKPTKNIFLYPKNDINFGTLQITMSLVDIANGNILWMNNAAYENIDLRDQTSVHKMLKNTLQNFPHHSINTTSIN